MAPNSKRSPLMPDRPWVAAQKTSQPLLPGAEPIGEAGERGRCLHDRKLEVPGRRVSAPAVAAARGPASHLLALQRAAGNRAVGEMLAQRGPRPEVLSLQRYEAGE